MFGKKFHGYDWIEIAPNNYTFNTPGNKYIVDFEMYPHGSINDTKNVYVASSLRLLNDSGLLIDNEKEISFGNKYLKYKQKYLSLKSKI
jgi:hypothetical protein